MSLKLMYITNCPEIAQIAENAGVDRVFVDMEFIGKQIRQGGMNTVQNRHTVEDVRKIRAVLNKAELMVRVNPIHEAGYEGDLAYSSSKDEIDAVIDAGADVLMLPFFKTVEEVEQFVAYVDGRAKVFPLLETPQAVAVLDKILEHPGIDEIHVGINDLCLGQKKDFMFELVVDGTVGSIAKKCKAHGIPFGFGGIASLGQGMLPAEYIIAEHYYLGSQYAILSRSFCNYPLIDDIEKIRNIFDSGVAEIRALEENLKMRIEQGDEAFFTQNREEMKKRVLIISKKIREQKRES